MNQPRKTRHTMMAVLTAASAGVIGAIIAGFLARDWAVALIAAVIGSIGVICGWTRGIRGGVVATMAATPMVFYVGILLEEALGDPMLNKPVVLTAAMYVAVYWWMWLIPSIPLGMLCGAIGALGRALAERPLCRRSLWSAAICGALAIIIALALIVAVVRTRPSSGAAEPNIDALELTPVDSPQNV